MACGVHVGITAREKDEQVSVQTEDGKVTSVYTGRKTFDSYKGMDYNVKTILRMFRDEDDQVCCVVEKDRTKTFTVGDVVVNPSLTAFEATINKGAGRKSFAIKNDLDDAIHKDREIFEKDVLGDIAEDEPTVTVGGANAEDLINSINDVMRGLSQADRDKKKAALASASLPATPAAIKKISDSEVLNKILEIVKA
jgi:hypothetical protein